MTMLPYINKRDISKHGGDAHGVKCRMHIGKTRRANGDMLKITTNDKCYGAWHVSDGMVMSVTRVCFHNVGVLRGDNAR